MRDAVVAGVTAVLVAVVGVIAKVWERLANRAQADAQTESVTVGTLVEVVEALRKEVARLSDREKALMREVDALKARVRELEGAG